MTATYDSIATTTLGSAGKITFTNIPATFTDLRLVAIYQSASFLNDGIYINFNNDTGSNYSTTRLQGEGANASSNRSTNATEIYIGPGGNTQWSLHTLDIFSYTGSTNKTCLMTVAQDRNGSGNVWVGAALWRSTAAINRIDVNLTGNNMATGTIVTLYGIKAE